MKGCAFLKLGMQQLRKTWTITSISGKAGIRLAEKRTRRKMGSTPVHGKILLVMLLKIYEF